MNLLQIFYKKRLRMASAALTSGQRSLLTDRWRSRPTRRERIAGVARWTATDRVMRGDPADSFSSARSRTWIFAFLLNASLVGRTVAINDTFCEKNTASLVWKLKIVRKKLSVVVWSYPVPESPVSLESYFMVISLLYNGSFKTLIICSVCCLI